MADLIDMKCIPYRGGEPQLTEEEATEFLLQIPEWEIIEVDGIKRLRRVFAFKNFADALSFTNHVGEMAEEQDHHPAILTEWGKVTLTWWTHIIHGLHQNDFVSAAKTGQQYNELSNY
jgi:4a-hydroxytetrahydrobiopterin dehydratase